jgi:hypothetical protein
MIKLKHLLEQNDWALNQQIQHATGFNANQAEKEWSRDRFKDSSGSIDDMVDTVSLLLDVTGVGAGVSSAIDAAHSLSYFIRYKWFSDTYAELFENMAMGIVTGIAAIVPVAGNITAITARNVIKKGINLTIHAPRIAGFGWKAMLAVLLKKVIPQETLEAGIEKLSDNLAEIESKIKQKFGNIDLLSVFSRIREFLTWLVNTALPSVINI